MKIRTTIALLQQSTRTNNYKTFQELRDSQQELIAGPPMNVAAPREAKQFDFLLGQWEIVAEPHVSFLVATIHGQPKLPGIWKAWRALDGFAPKLALFDAVMATVVASIASPPAPSTMLTVAGEPKSPQISWLATSAKPMTNE